MGAKYLVGDVFDRLAEIPDGSVDLALTSPPFLALRSYLPDDHPDKAKEIGSEPTPAEFLDTMLALTAELGRVLAPHGSLAVEIGDTYSGSGGAGGDYNADGMRGGQPRFRQQGSREHRPEREGTSGDGGDRVVPVTGGRGWPLDKSLCGLPTLYAWCLAYGRNLLTGEPSPAGMWRVRNIKPWIRSNPPVGALGDKERPATSYITVATRSRARYFDLDAVRTRLSEPDRVQRRVKGSSRDDGWMRPEDGITQNTAGAPPRDWWHHVDEVLNAELDRMSKVDNRAGQDVSTRTHGVAKPGEEGEHRKRYSLGASTTGARGVHLRRALERAGILRTVDALDVSPKGYAGAHYATWPPELVRLLVDEMTPRKVCTTCGLPSRRIVEAKHDVEEQRRRRDAGSAAGKQVHDRGDNGASTSFLTTQNRTVGWTDCGHGTWRPGLVLDPFAGSGTTLAVCTGMARDAIGIDLDESNVDLARERVGMFLEVDYG